MYAAHELSAVLLGTPDVMADMHRNDYRHLAYHEAFAEPGNMWDPEGTKMLPNGLSERILDWESIPLRLPLSRDAWPDRVRNYMTLAASQVTDLNQMPTAEQKEAARRQQGAAYLEHAAYSAQLANRQRAWLRDMPRRRTNSVLRLVESMGPNALPVDELYHSASSDKSWADSFHSASSNSSAKKRRSATRQN